MNVTKETSSSSSNMPANSPFTNQIEDNNCAIADFRKNYLLFTSFIEILQSTVKTVSEIETNANMDREIGLKNLLADLEAFVAHLNEGKFNLAIFGQTNTGKSTFITELFEHQVRLPQSECNGCTRSIICTTYSADPSRKFTVEGEQFTAPQIPGDKLEKGVDGRPLVTIRAPLKILAEGLQVFDTPGVNDEEGLTNLVYNLLEEIDPRLIIYVCVLGKMFQGRDSITLEKINKNLQSSIFPLKYVFVMNKFDDIHVKRNFSDIQSESEDEDDEDIAEDDDKDSSSDIALTTRFEDLEAADDDDDIDGFSGDEDDEDACDEAKCTDYILPNGKVNNRVLSESINMNFNKIREVTRAVEHDKVLVYSARQVARHREALIKAEKKCLSTNTPSGFEMTHIQQFSVDQQRLLLSKITSVIRNCVCSDTHDFLKKTFRIVEAMYTYIMRQTMGQLKSSLQREQEQLAKFSRHSIEQLFSNSHYSVVNGLEQILKIDFDFNVMFEDIKLILEQSRKKSNAWAIGDTQQMGVNLKWQFDGASNISMCSSASGNSGVLLNEIGTPNSNSSFLSFKTLNTHQLEFYGPQMCPIWRILVRIAQHIGGRIISRVQNEIYSYSKMFEQDRSDFESSLACLNVAFEHVRCPIYDTYSGEHLKKLPYSVLIKHFNEYYEYFANLMSPAVDAHTLPHQNTSAAASQHQQRDGQFGSNAEQIMRWLEEHRSEIFGDLFKGLNALIDEEKDLVKRLVDESKKNVKEKHSLCQQSLDEINLGLTKLIRERWIIHQSLMNQTAKLYPEVHNESKVIRTMLHLGTHEFMKLFKAEKLYRCNTTNFLLPDSVEIIQDDASCSSGRTLSKPKWTITFVLYTEPVDGCDELRRIARSSLTRLDACLEQLSYAEKFEIAYQLLKIAKQTHKFNFSIDNLNVKTIFIESLKTAAVNSEQQCAAKKLFQTISEADLEKITATNDAIFKWKVYIYQFSDLKSIIRDEKLSNNECRMSMGSLKNDFQMIGKILAAFVYTCQIGSGGNNNNNKETANPQRFCSSVRGDHLTRHVSDKEEEKEELMKARLTALSKFCLEVKDMQITSHEDFYRHIERTYLHISHDDVASSSFPNESQTDIAITNF